MDTPRIRLCYQCKKRPALRRDGYCSARCKRKDFYRDWLWCRQNQPAPAKVD